MRNPKTQLRAEELLPLEMLAGRLQAVRSQTRMLEKLIDSEKFAGLGQLAANVTQQCEQSSHRDSGLCHAA